MLSELTQFYKSRGYTCSLGYTCRLASWLVGRVWREDGNYHIVNSIRRKIQIGHTVMNTQVMILLLRAGLLYASAPQNVD